MLCNADAGTPRVISSIRPNMDGITATKWIRAHEEGHIPIIALTAQATTTDKQTCLLAGMDVFLAKPAK